MAEHCLSCGKDVCAINNSIAFDCPKCGAKIVRCGSCRGLGINYECKCGFKGL